MLKKTIGVLGLGLGLFLAAQTVRAVDVPAVPALPIDDGTTAATALPVEVPASDANLRYVGRFDTKGSDASYAWSASAITIHFHGTAVNAKLNGGRNFFEVIVDGQPAKALSSTVVADTLYSLASGLPEADHTVTIFKRTEAKFDVVHFLGFQLNQGATLLPAPPADRRIEVIGDSISCGYGNEAASYTEHFSTATENAYRSYGAVTARAFGAEYVCIAWSGRTLWPHFTMPEIYDLTLPKDTASTWNFDGWKPQVVLINLCTNDFNKTMPEQEAWVKAYHDFIAHVRKNYPDAAVYLALGPMMSDSYPAGAKALTTARGYIQRVVKECNDAGDAKIRFIEFDQQNGGANGIGADWHPSAKTHAVMAQKFIAAIQADLGWKPVVAVP